MKRSRIAPMSEKKKARLPDELAVRIKLGERAGGTWIPDGGISYGGYILGGKCELCHQPQDFRGLAPAEVLTKARGGKLSLDNSLVCCQRCHDHTKYPHTGVPLTVEEGLELIKKLNKED